MLTPFLVIALALALIVAGIRTSDRKKAAVFLVTAGALIAWGSFGDWEKKVPPAPRRTSPSLVAWTSIDAAQAKAAATHQLIMYEFSADWCAPCRQMEQSFENAPIASAINRQFVAVRYPERNTGAADLVLCAHETLAHRCRRDEERGCDRRRVEPEHDLQDQRRADRGVDGRMRAREHQRETMIGNVRLRH